MSQQFWIVWNEKKGLPTKKHTTFESAKAESERLARQYPGDEINVLRLVGSSVKRDVDWNNASDAYPKWFAWDMARGA